MSADLKQIVGTILVFAGAATESLGFGIVLYAAGASLLASGARQSAKDAQEEARLRAGVEAASRSVKANVRGSSETHFLVFGKVRVGGVICALGTSPTNTNILHIGIAHSIVHSGGCDGIGALWLNDEKIDTADISGDGLSADATVTLAKFVYSGTNMVAFRHYRGTSTQSADATLISESIDSSSDVRRGICWTRFTLTRSTIATTEAQEAFNNAFPRGVPNISAELSGCRCYDPRADSTNGGSGSQRFTDATTWAWSQNPAVIAATYMIMEVSDGGMGYAASRIDWPSVASAANICDEVTDDGQSPTVAFTRYQCNIALDTAMSREENLRKILDTMQGARVRVGNKFKLYAGAYRAPTFTLDHTFLRGPVTISTRSSLEQLYNAVRVVHDDAEQSYRTVEAPPFTSAAYEVQDGGERMWKEIVLPGVTNTSQAQYIAQIVGNLSRKQKIIEAPCNLKALDIEAWETGNVTFDELGISGDVYRVIGWEWEADGPKVTLREETTDIYNTSAMAAAITDAAPDPNDEVPDTPSSVTASGVLEGINIAWAGPDTNAIKQIDVYRSADAGSSSPTPAFTLVASVVGYEYTDYVGSGTYYYKLKSRSHFGVQSSFSSEVSAAAQEQPNVSSQGNGVAVYQGLNPDTNEHEFSPAVAGDGIEISESSSGLVINATAVEVDHIYLSADSSTTSVTLADVGGFKFQLEPSSIYEVELTGLVQTAATTTGFKIGATAPTGTALMTLHVVGPSTSESTGFNGFDSGTTSVSVTTADMPASSTTYPFVATFVIVTGTETGSPTTGFVGNFQIQFATEVGSSSATLKQYSLMALSKMSTATPAGTLALQAPGLATAYTSTETRSGGPISAALTLSALADGTWTITRDSGDSGDGTPTSGNWGTPTTAGQGANYEVKFTYTNHNGVGSIDNQASDWTTLNSTKAFTLTVSKNGFPGTSTGNLDVQMQVRERGTSTPVSDGTTDFTVTAIVTV